MTSTGGPWPLRGSRGACTTRAGLLDPAFRQTPLTAIRPCVPPLVAAERVVEAVQVRGVHQVQNSHRAEDQRNNQRDLANEHLVPFCQAGHPPKGTPTPLISPKSP